jgi:hypothetical protein
MISNVYTTISQKEVPSAPDAPSSYQWVVAWMVVIIIAAIVANTEAGYRIIYYSLVLIFVVLLVTQYQFIANALAPVGQTVPTSN